MKTIILAGGLGTRLSEKTTIRPKPMVEIGGYPILWHIMKIYSHFGYRDFGIAMGYKSNVIMDYFINFHYQQSNITIDLSTGSVEVYDKSLENWRVYLAHTGMRTQTGGRLKRMKDWVCDDTFMMTYGDGVADLDINELVRFHKSHGKLVTLTAVRPPSRFGGVKINDDSLVMDFKEKPQIGEGWINGGFFVIEPEALEFVKGDETPWEHSPLERLSDDGQLAAYGHDGYWQCMDTIREVDALEKLWQTGSAPWKIWG